MSLRDVRYEGGRMRFEGHRHQEPGSRLADHLEEARVLLAEPPAAAEAQALDVGGDFEDLRWFWLPQEVAEG